MSGLDPPSPAEAITCFLRGIPLTLSDPALRKLMRRALFLNLLVIIPPIGLIVVVFSTTAGVASSGFLAGLVVHVGRVVLVLFVLMITPVLLVVVGAIILPTQRSRIFRAARGLAGAPEVEEGGIGAELHSIGIDIRRLLGFLLRSLLLLPLNLMPFIGQALYLITQSWLVAHTMGWDIFGRHYELHGIGYRAQRRHLKEHRVLVLGLGAIGALLCMIPIAQVLFVNTNAAGAGLLSARLDGHWHWLPPRPGIG